MRVTLWSRGPKLVFAAVFAGAVLLASGSAALAWVAPEGKANCDNKQMAITLKDVKGDYATSDTLDFSGPSGKVFTEKYAWTQGQDTLQTFAFPLSDFPPGDYSVHPAKDDSASATGHFTVKECPAPPTTMASPPRTNQPPPSSSGSGQASTSTPGLPATGFAPDN